MVKFIFTLLLPLIILVPLEAYDHPSIIFTSEDVNMLRARSQASPYSDYLFDPAGSISTYADLNNWSGEWAEAYRGLTAKSCAFLYVIDPSSFQSYGDKALNLLTTADAAKYSTPHDMKSGLAWYAQAFDMLKGSGGYTDPELAAARGKIVADMNLLRDDWALIMRFGLEKGLEVILNDHNNIGIRRYSAIILAGIATDGLTVSEIDKYKSVLDSSVDHMIDDGGGWAEGPNYMVYTYQLLLPLFLSMRNNNLFDYFQEDHVKKNFLWSFDTRMPDGNRPNHDDSHLLHFPNALLSDEENGGFYNFDFDLIGRQLSRVDIGLWVELYCRYNAAVSPKEPEYTSLIIPEAGSVVFRTGWTENATYLFVSAEHGDARTHGYGHEHSDAGSFILHSGGNTMVHDSGYAGFEESKDLRSGDAHNTILVDGKGIPGPTLGSAGGVDVHIASSILYPNCNFAELNYSYENADFERYVLFLDDAFFVLSDRVSASSVHEYTWLLHGMGGGTTGGTFTPGFPTWNGGIYSYQGTDLMVFTASSPGSPTSFSTSIDVFAPYHVRLDHTRYEAKKNGDDLTFLSVLYPSLDPVLTPLTTSDGSAQAVRIEDPSRIAGVVSQHASSPLTFSISNNDIDTDARVAYFNVNKEKKNGMERQSLFVAHGSYLKNKGDAVFVASSNLDALYVEKTESAWHGRVHLSSPMSVSFYSPRRPVCIQAECGHGVFAAPFVTFNFSGSSNFRIEWIVKFKGQQGKK